MDRRRATASVVVLALLLVSCASDGNVPSSPAPVNTRTPVALPATPAPATSGTAPTTGWRVVAAYPHDPDAFTQGLAFVDGELWEGTGLVGESSLRQVELATGKVLRQTDLPAPHFGEGIVVVGERIWQLTWRSGIAFVYDRATLEVVARREYAGEGWGIAWDGARFVTSDGSATLTFRDAVTFAPSGSITVHDAGTPVTQLNELEWVDGELWAAVWKADRVARIDPASGAVTGWLDLAGLHPADEREDADREVFNGIAWDAASGRIFVTGKRWPWLYEIAIVAAE